MNYTEFSAKEDAAWRAFYETVKLHGLSDAQVNRLRTNLDNKDCFNDVSDCLADVSELTDD